MENDFDRWNTLKKLLSLGGKVPAAFPQPGEVWVCTLGHNLGREQNGGKQDFSRPVLIVHKFNNGMFWVAPLSSKQKDLDFYFNYKDAAGADASVILAQLRLVSINRLHRNMYHLPENLFRQIRVRLRGFLS